MNFLADMGVSESILRRLIELGHHAVHVRQYGMNRSPDSEILSRAFREERIVLTFDLDFGEILAASGASAPSVIIFRLRDQTPDIVAAKLFEMLTPCEAALDEGSIIIVEERRYRVRRLPI